MQHQSSQTRVPRFARVVPTKPLTIICFHVSSLFLLSQATSEWLNINLRPTPCRTTYPTPRQTIRLLNISFVAKEPSKEHPTTGHLSQGESMRTKIQRKMIHL